MLNLLWGVAVVLIGLWLLGFSLHVAGAAIHMLLVVALLVVVARLFLGRRVA